MVFSAFHLNICEADVTLFQDQPYVATMWHAWQENQSRETCRLDLMVDYWAKLLSHGCSEQELLDDRTESGKDMGMLDDVGM